MFGFSAALCRGLIEALTPVHEVVGRRRGFSAALCRGLIEAWPARTPSRGGPHGFPRLYVAASLKPAGSAGRQPAAGAVFRGFMSRPH